MSCRQQRARSLPRLAFAMFVLAAAAVSAAQDPADPAADQIQRWLHQLAADDFAVRRRAADELVARGQAAVDAVAEAAEASDRETALRCLDVLSQLHESDNAAVRDQAAAALTRLSESSDAALAQRAQGLLAEHADVEDIQARGSGFRGAPFRLQFVQPVGLPFDQNGERRAEVEASGKTFEIVETQAGEIRVRIIQTVNGQEQTQEIVAENSRDLRRKDVEAYLMYRRHIQHAGGPVLVNAQALAQGALNQQIVVTNVNGERTIRVNEGGRRIEIRDRDGKNIRMTVTDELGGQPQTNEYEASDLDELRGEHAAAAELYEKYTEQAPGFQIQAFVNAGRPGAPVPGFGGGDTEKAKGAADSIEQALDELTAVRRQLEELKTHDNADKDTLDQLVQKLDAAEQSLFEAQSRLE